MTGFTKPPGGTDIVSLGIGVDTSQMKEFIEVGQRMGTATVSAVKNLNELTGAADKNAASIRAAKANYENQIQVLERLWREEQAVKNAELEAEKVRQAGIQATSNLIVKLERLVATYGLTKEELLRFTAAELGAAEAANPLIAKLEALRISSEQLAIQQKRDTELFLVKQKELAAQEAAAQRQIEIQQRRDAELNALRQKQAAEESAAAEKQILIQQRRDAELNALVQSQSAQEAAAAEKRIAIEQKRDAELHKLRQKQEADYVAFWEKELAIQEAASAKAITLAETQALEEIKWNQRSVNSRIAELERLKIAQATPSIRPETIGNEFSAGAIKDLPLYIANQKAYIKTIEETSAAHARGHDSAATFGEALSGINFNASRARSELIVLAHEVVQGRFSRIPASMMVLGEYTNAASLAFTGMGVAALAAVGVLATMGYAVVKGIVQQKEMSDALIMTGNYAGVTAGALHEMAVAAAGSSNSISEAKKTVTELAASGKFTGDQIKYVSDAVVSLEHATGQSIETTIKQFESLEGQSVGHTNRAADAISKAILKLDDQYHFLNESVYEQIRALEREGKQREASALATKVFADELKIRAAESVANLGAIERAWKGIKQAIGGAIDAIGEWGKKETSASRVDKLKADIAAVEGGYAGGSLGVYNASSKETVLTKLRQDLTQATRELNNVNDRAFEQAEKARTQSEGAHAAEQVTSDNIRRQRKETSELTIALKEYESQVQKIKAANPNSALVTDDVIAKTIADIKREHSRSVGTRGNDDRAKRLQDSLILEQTALDREKSIYDKRLEMLDLYHKKFGTEDSEYYAGRQNTRDEYIAAEAIAFAKESSLINSYKPKNAQEIAANKVKYDTLLRQHLEFLDKMNAARGADETNRIAANQKAFDDISSAIEKEGNKELEALDKSIAKQKEHNAEIGKTKEQIELAKQAQVESATATMEREADAIRALLNESDLQDVLQGRYREIYTERLAYLDRIIGKRKEEANIIQEGAIKEAQAVLDKAWEQSNKKIGDDLASAIVDGGGKGWKKLIHDMEIGFAKMVLQPILQPIAGAISSFLNPNATQAGGNNLLGTAQQGYSAYNAIGSAGNALFGSGSGTVASYLGGTSAVAPTSVLAANATGAMGGDALGSLIASEGWSAGGASLAAGAGELGGVGLAAGATEAGGAALAAGATEIGAAAATGATTGIAAGLAAVPVVGWIGLAALAAYSMFGGDNGPEKNTSLRFNSNNTAGNIDINKRGNEGRGTQAYANYGNGTQEMGVQTAFGSYGVDQTFWANQAQLPSYLASIRDTDNALAAQLTDIEKQKVTAFVTGKQTTVGTGAEGADTSAGLAIAFSERVNSVFEGVETGLSKLLDGFSGTSQQLEVEAVALLTYRKNIADLDKVFGQSVTLQELATLKTSSESVATAIARLVSTFTATNNLALLLGKTMEQEFGSSGLGSEAVRQRLVDVSGGIDQFQQGLSFLAQNFFTETEQLTPIIESVTSKLKDLGFSGVATRDQFKSVVKGLDTTTDAGARTYAELIKLGPAFIQFSDWIKKMTDAAAEAVQKDQADKIAAVDAQYSILSRSVDVQKSALQKTYDEQVKIINDQVTIAKQAAQAQQQSASDSLNAIQSIFSALKNALNSIQIESDADARTSAQAVLNAALSFSNAGGSLGNYNGLEKALQVVSKPSEDLFATFVDYKRDQVQTYNTISRLTDNAGAQVSVAQMTLDAINATITTIESSSSAQLIQLETSHNDDIARLDAILAEAQAQIDNLKGINTSVMSVTDAVTALGTLIGAARTATSTQGSAATTVNSLYNNILSRNPDSSGGAYWTNQIASGAVTSSDLANTLANAKPVNDAVLAKYAELGRTGSSIDEEGLLYWTNQANQLGVAAMQQNFDNSVKAIRGYAVGGVADGWSIVGEKGPELVNFSNPGRVYTADETRAMLSKQGSSQELIKELQDMNTALITIVINTSRTARKIEKWDGDGIPEERTVTA